MIEVTCAIIRDNDTILATRRAHGMHLAGQWEFPGGKIEPGETAKECIVREIAEELNIKVQPVARLYSVDHHYPDKSIRLIPFVCKLTNGEIHLAEHAEYRWVKQAELSKLDWAAADRKLIELNGMG